jgi:PAS domain S-box-containing protein
LTGWSYEEALEVPLDRVFRIVNEDSRLPVESPATRALREGIVVGLANHTVLLRKDGGECPIDDSAAPIRNEAGSVSGCVLIFRDVTELRRMEREKASQLHTARVLAAIIETSDDAIISKTLDGIIQSWNAGAERLFGHTAEQAVGQHISIVLPPERLQEEDEIIARLRAGERIDHFETERIRKDGQRILVSLSISPIRDESGTVVGASKIARDVTHHRYAEHRERQLLADTAAANAKFQAFFEQGALFAAILDVDGNVLEPNRLFAEGCGFTRNEIIGRPVWEGPWWVESAESRARIQAAATEAAGGLNARAEVSYRTADGSKRNGVVVIQPIKRYADQVLFLALSGADITDRKRLEDDLREADRKKNEFLAMLAHELRNPLAPISNAARALRLGVGDAEAVCSASEMLERQVSLLARLVDDLLDISRITRGTIELRTTRTALGPIVLQAIEAVRPLAKSMNHEVTTTLPKNEIYVEADPARLTQVVGNILNNACKFTNAGGQIQLIVSQDNQEAAIRVCDNGIGIAPEHLPLLFDMFAQVDASLERSRDGLGIGLTLVKTLVELHGGSVTVNSGGPGRGSEFTVRLPVVEPALPAVASAAAPARPAVPQRVLIVDDNDDGAESLSMLLQFDGHETLKAHTGPEALDAAARFRPDVMLLDIGLPGMSGYEVCRRIRREPWGQAMLIVALTGWGQEEDRKRSEEAGFDTHMVKPVDHEMLLRLLASIPGSDDVMSQMT